MSWEADKQLVRTTEKGTHNLAVGEPKFLREVFKPFYPKHYPFNVDLLAYPDTKPLPELEEQLREISGGKHIVVTNGAKQGLLAALCAFKTGTNYNGLEALAPYWPSYPTMAKLSGLSFNSHGQNVSGQYDIIVNTSPNNPDGKQRLYHADIWDAVYFHSIYGAKLFQPIEAGMAVWSAGKLLGSPGTRLGWISTDDEELAELSRRYVEQTTSGVSTVSQYHVSQTLYATQNIRKDLFEEAREVLIQNYIVFRDFMGEFVTVPEWERSPLRVGMFAYFTAHNPEKFHEALQKSKVLLVSGASCGDNTEGTYRMSLGLTTPEMKAALEALNKAYKEI